MDKLIFLFVLLTKISVNYSNEGRKLQIKDILPQLGIPTPIEATTIEVFDKLPNLVEELLENKDAVAALQQGIEAESSNQSSEKDSKLDANSTMLESLTDSDLQTLLQNFKHLSTEEQHHLITHLKKLESTDPVRVEGLRKFVNLNELNDGPSTSKNHQHKLRRFNLTPPPNSNAASNNMKEKPTNYSDEDEDHRRGVGVGVGGGAGGGTGIKVTNPNKFSLDDETDDDYDFEKIFETAKKSAHRGISDIKTKTNVNNNRDISLDVDINTIKSKIDEPKKIIPTPLDKNDLNINLADTQNIIANLMGSLQASNKSMPLTKPLLSMVNLNLQANKKQQGPGVLSPQQQQQQKKQLVPSQHIQQQQQQRHHQPQHPANNQHSQNLQQQQNFQHSQNYHAQPQNSNMPFYQQQQPQQQPHQQSMYPGGAGSNMVGGFNQMPNAGASYYNMPMADGSNAAYNNGPNQQYAPNQSYPGWNANPQNMQGYGGNYMPQQQQQMNYNMYGGGSGR